jgi:hypothetical protein
LIFIEGNVPSSKNSKVKTSHGVFSSAAVRKYLQKIGVKKYRKDFVEGYKKRPNLFDTPELRAEFYGAEYPIVLGVHFVRKTRGRFDFINMCQLIFDLLVAHQVIPDDDMNHLEPVPMKINGATYTINKERPGVYLACLDFKLPEWVVK